MDLQSNQMDLPKNVNAWDTMGETIPAINLFKGMPVIKGIQGYEPLQDKDGKNMDVHELIDELKGSFNKILITDINGINRDKPQLELYQDMSTKMKLWIDAGPRSKDGAIDILVAGAEKVVLGTKTLRGLEELEKVVELSENVVLGIDYDNGIVTPKKRIREMSPLSLVNEAKNLGIEEIIFTDLKHLASDSHFSMDIGATLLQANMKIYFHGRFDGGMEMFKRMNLAGVMIEVEILL